MRGSEGSLNVRFAPKATELLRRSEMTLQGQQTLQAPVMRRVRPAFQFAPEHREMDRLDQQCLGAASHRLAVLR